MAAAEPVDALLASESAVESAVEASVATAAAGRRDQRPPA